MMKGSPHKRGSSNLLAERFAEGAREAGHEVEAFDVAKARIAPCLGCDACRRTGRCRYDDDMAAVRDGLLGSDMAVFVTPLYYFGMSAQLKTAIDRFYAFNAELSGKRLDAALVAAAWDDKDWTMRDLAGHYQTICRYLGLEDRGMVLGAGCGTPAMTGASPLMRKAYDLGRSL